LYFISKAPLFSVTTWPHIGHVELMVHVLADTKYKKHAR